MRTSLSTAELNAYVGKQVNAFFPDGRNIGPAMERTIFNEALERTERCFRDVTLRAYRQDGEPYFNHLYSDQYAVFIWMLSSSVWNRTQDRAVADKLFYLNKALHGFSCMYDTRLPEVFLLFHTVGTVLGKAEYENYFVAAQGTTIGAQNGHYPIIGQGVALLPNSSVIGRCTIGNRVSIGIDTSVYEQDIPSCSVVFTSRTDGSQQIKQKANCWAQKFFSVTV
ncbi:hypothetical protein [Paenibacillus mendelii]|uniref:Serine acetyltransferase n=1 Tax=Paenibacillus mendelii TaxID=206163 RepID=A0ABV6J6D8_9BACL|nr:hypothetical protein [Paenibacillus mendelii]MCQ6563576.1 hypothetical protein [Paenibacillus mendelii]